MLRTVSSIDLPLRVAPRRPSQYFLSQGTLKHEDMNIPTTTTTTPKATTLQSAGLALSVSSVFGVMDQDVREVSGQEKELREMVPGFLISEYFTGIVFSLRKFVHTGTVFPASPHSRQHQPGNGAPVCPVLHAHGSVKSTRTVPLQPLPHHLCLPLSPRP